MQQEYQGATSRGGAYTSLANYNNGQAMAPVSNKVVTGVMVVPSWGAIGVDTLTHQGGASRGGYFNIESAYGAGASSCNQAYVTMPCSGQGCGNQ
jgi:hypothetical protein